jgi:hypothetical protein
MISVSGFAKNLTLIYTPYMNDETIIPPVPESLSNIKDEDQFQDAITAAKKK